MRHTLRDIFIWCIDTFGIAFVYRLSVRKRGPLVRIVVFHDVADRTWFLETVSYLCTHYNVLTPDEFVQGVFSEDKINILISFDDGYASWIDICVPILEKYNLKALFFTNTGLLEVAEDAQKTTQFMREQLHITPKAPLTWEGVRILQKNGHTLGAHSHMHFDLAALMPAVLRQDIESEKVLYTKRLSYSPVHFAYPFGTKGHRTDEVFAHLKETGYTHVYNATGYFVCHGQFEISRMCIEKNQSLSSIRRWVGGAYDIFLMCKSVRW